ncbi:MAG: ATP-binding protein [Chloroflexi bacterium]|nr:MAG: ATP-binding protein [Chloroflexota bacterium]
MGGQHRCRRPSLAAPGSVRILRPPAQPGREPADHRQAGDQTLRADSRARRPHFGSRGRSRSALEYTSGPVQVEARQVQRGWLEITVADNGQGLPAGTLDTVFEKTGPAGRSRSQGGLGLGLYLCRLVVERSFGGRIWVAASDKRGTTFRFTVPARIRT